VEVGESLREPARLAVAERARQGHVRQLVGEGALGIEELAVARARRHHHHALARVGGAHRPVGGPVAGGRGGGDVLAVLDHADLDRVEAGKPGEIVTDAAQVAGGVVGEARGQRLEAALGAHGDARLGDDDLEGSGARPSGEKDDG